MLRLIKMNRVHVQHPYSVVFLVVTALLLFLYANRPNDCKPNKRNDLTEAKPAIPDRIVKGSFSGERRQGLHAQILEPLHFPVRRNDSFDYKDAMMKLNEEQVAPDDPRLIELIRNYYIVPPSSEQYVLKEDKLDYSMGQSSLVDSMLNFMEGGFYVECGACDGEWGANTLFFEKVRKWNGVLIEADPSNFEKLLEKHRKAFMINACLSSTPYPSTVTFRQGYILGKIVNTSANADVRGRLIEVQCFPLYSILLALNQLHVDFLSLDVEGAELDVLQNIPFDKVDINVMAVEYVHTPGGEEGVKKFGWENGFLSLFRFDRIDNLARDIIFKSKEG